MKNKDKVVAKITRDEAKVEKGHVVVVPKCPCGKTPLRCPHPDNCKMESL